MVPKTHNQLEFSDLTSIIDGKELSGMVKTWEDVATSEARLNLLARLKEKKLGFQEVEKFSLGLKYSLKSGKYQDNSEGPIKKVVQAAMELKLRDESSHCDELKRKREKMKRGIGEKYHPRTEKYLKII